MKKTNMILVLAVSAAMAAMTACGGSGQSAAPAATTAAAAAATEAPAAQEAAAPAGDVKAIEAGVCETPAVLTSIGQSADVDIVNTICSKAGIEVTKDSAVSADTLPADCKTLILAVGGSSKGLGAAGIDADQELARAAALFEKAKSQGTKIVALHTGGSARRGTLSDSFIVPAFEAADIVIVVEEGDSDGLMKGIASKNGAAMEYVKQIADCMTTLKTLFGK